MDLTYPTEDWRTCFHQLGPRLLIFARQWLPSLADAEDAVQEAFIRFWRKHESFEASHQGLLFAAVRTVALDHLRSETRRARREQAAFLQDTGGSFFTAPEFAEPSEPNRLLEIALRSLPLEQREILTLKIWGELTFAEIAAALEISQNTAASRYRYALSTLRKLLQPVAHE